jgi:MIP family channel proteins
LQPGDDAPEELGQLNFGETKNRNTMQVSQRVHTAANRRTSDGNKASKKITWTDVNNYARRLFGEFVGTFILTWVHAGLALSLSNTAVTLESQPDQRVSIAADAFGSGLSLAGLVYGLGNISGAHFNPSISLVFVLRGDMNPLSWFPYVAAQVAGGFAAAGILDAVFINDDAHGNLGANHPSGGFTILAAFWMEFIGSAFLQLAIVGTAARGKNIGGHAALAAGLTIGSLIAYLAPYGGGGLNPARSIGPGVLASNPDVRGSTWIYVVAPLGASLFSGLILKWLAPKQDKKGEDENAVGALQNNSTTAGEQQHEQDTSKNHIV